MKTALIIHGSGGAPDEIWFPWLKEKLERDGFKVLCPQFPNGLKSQTLSNWLEVMEGLDIPEDSIAIGHSLGCPFILNLLERRKFKAVYLVGGFVGLLSDHFNPAIKTFSDREFDWVTIKENCKHSYVIYSDNDPHVPPEKALELSKKLEVEPILIEGAGHFNSEVGYFEFPILYDLILNDLK